MAAEFPLSSLPDKYASKIQEIALKTGLSNEEVVAEMTRLVLDLAFEYPDEDESCIMRRLRSALREKFGISPDRD